MLENEHIRLLTKGLVARGAPNRYDDQGPNKFDWEAMATAADLASFSTEKAVSMARRLVKYRNTQLPEIAAELGIEFDGEELLEFSKKMTATVSVMRYEDRYGSRIALRFPFHRDAQDALKQALPFPQSKFDGDHKVWSIQDDPAVITTAVQTLQDFDYDFSPWLGKPGEGAPDQGNSTQSPSPSPTIAAVEKDGLRLNWPYIQDPELRDIVRLKVKSIPGARFDWDEKVWTVPLAHSHTLYKEVDGVYQPLADAIAELPEVQEYLEGALQRVAISQAAVLDDEQVAEIEGRLSGVFPGDLSLYPFQYVGVAFAELAAGRCLIGDDMGLGKSVMSLAYAALHQEEWPVLVVCPANVKYNWVNEIEKWIPNATVSAVKSGKGPIQNTDFVVINYDLMHRKVSGLEKMEPNLVIIDEAHYISNSDAKRTKATLRISTISRKVLCLSGTPISNRPKEFFTVLNLLRPAQFPSFYKFAQQYCVPATAPILMADFTEKPISKITIGDKVIGWSREEGGQRRLCEAEVIDTLVRVSPLQNTTLEDGTVLTSTPDHRWLTGYSNRDPEVMYQKARTGRFGGQGRGCASKVVRIAPSVPREQIDSDDYRTGYFYGLMAGDGHCSRHTKRIYNPFKDKTTEGISSHNVSFFSTDEILTHRVNELLPDHIHRSIKYRGPIRNGNKDGWQLSACNKEAYDYVISCGEKDTDDWWAGFLGGIYDAEGSGQTIAQYLDLNPTTYDLIRRGLQRFDFDYKPSQKTIRMRGGRSELLRFFGLTRPLLRRKLVNYMFNGGGKFMMDVQYVTDIKPLEGEHIVYTLTTSTGNYVAYGMGSKNCGAYHNGYGWDFSGASNTKQLNERIRDFTIRRLKSEVLAELPPKVRTFFPVELDGSERKEYERSKLDWVGKYHHYQDTSTPMPKGFVLNMLTALRHVCGQMKVTAAVEWAKEYRFQTDKPLVIYGHHKDVISNLKEELPDDWRVASITGETPALDRATIVESFQDGELDVLVCSTLAAKEGITLTAADTVLFIEREWVPGWEEQAEDRVLRIGQESDSVRAVYLSCKGTIDEQFDRIVEEKRQVVRAVLDGGEGEVRAGIVKALLTKLADYEVLTS